MNCSFSLEEHNLWVNLMNDTARLQKHVYFYNEEDGELYQADLRGIACLATILLVIQDMLGKRKMFDLPEIINLWRALLAGPSPSSQ
jgi:hypothetical protein